MAKEYLDKDGLLYFWQKIKNTFALSSHTHTKSQITDFPSIPSKTSDLTNDSNYVADASYVHTDNNYTTTEKTKLSGIATGAEVNVQSDWNQTNTSADDYIKNKPTIPAGVTVDSALDSTSENPVQNKVIKSALDGIVQDDHKWNDVELSHTDFANTIGVNGDYRGYIPVIGGVASGDLIPSINSTSSKMLKLSTFASDGNSVAGRDKDGYLWSKTPTSGDSTTRVATTAFVGSAISGKVDSSAVGSANGVAPLNASSKIDSTYLPSYVDDVIEAYARSGATALSSTWLSETSGGSALTPETGKIYVLMADSGDYSANSQFRWGGTAYVKLADGGVSSITNAEIDTIVAS